MARKCHLLNEGPANLPDDQEPYVPDECPLFRRQLENRIFHHDELHRIVKMPPDEPHANQILIKEWIENPKSALVNQHSSSADRPPSTWPSRRIQDSMIWDNNPTENANKGPRGSKSVGSVLSYRVGYIDNVQERRRLKKSHREGKPTATPQHHLNNCSH